MLFESEGMYKSQCQFRQTNSFYQKLSLFTSKGQYMDHAFTNVRLRAVNETRNDVKTK